MHYVGAIQNNVITCIKAICDQVVEMGLQDSVEAQEELKLIKDADESKPLTPEYGEIIKTLWADRGVQKAWEKVRLEWAKSKRGIHKTHLSFARLMLMDVCTTIILANATLRSSLCSSIPSSLPPSLPPSIAAGGVPHH